MLRLSADGTGYFSRDPSPGANPQARIFAARAGAGGGFQTPVALAGAVNSALAEDPAIAADGSLLLFTSTRGGDGYDLWGAVRANGDFLTPSPLQPLNSAAPELSPYLLTSGKALYFSRVVAGTGVALLRTVSDGGSLGTPASTTAIPVVSNPVVSEDELELFYSENGDIFRATRRLASDPFATPVRSGALSSSGFDAPSWLSPDGCTMYLTSDRAGGAGSLDLWVASRK